MNKLYKLKIQISLILLFCAGAAGAQVATLYNFSQTSGSFSGLIASTVLGTSTNDDDTFGPFNIGFNFNYNGTVYTQFSVNTNGYIVMGTTTGSSTAVLSDATSNTGGPINNAIAAVSEDLIGQNNSTLWYQLQGNGNNHILVVEWKNYNMYSTNGGGTAGVGDALSFQIQLYETTNAIQVVYGTMTADATPFYNPEVGLRGNTSSDFNNRKIGNGNTWATSVPGTMNTDLCMLSSTLAPASGLTYTWTRTSVGIENTNPVAGSLFDIYPNPANGTLKLSIPTAHIDNCTISIYNIDGKTVYTEKDTNIIGNYSKVISTQNFSKGVYYIRIDTGNGGDVKKLIIQ